MVLKPENKLSTFGEVIIINHQLINELVTFLIKLYGFSKCSIISVQIIMSNFQKSNSEFKSQTRNFILEFQFNLKLSLFISTATIV
jgi:predicted nucleic acid-binding protein